MKKTKSLTNLETSAAALTNRTVNDVSSIRDSYDSPLRFTSAKSVYDNLKKPKATAVSNSSSKKKKKKTKRKVKKLESENDCASEASDSAAITNTIVEYSDPNSSDIRMSDSTEDENDTKDISETPVPDDSSVQDVKSVMNYRTLDMFDYVLVNEKSAVVFLPFSTCFYFKGRLKLTVLSGTIDILGHELEEDPRHINQVYSPRGYSLLCVRALQRKGNLTNASIKLLTEMGLQCTEDFPQSKTQENAIILLQLLENRMLDYLDRLFEINILRKESCIPPSSWGESEQTRFQQLCDGLDTNIVLRGAIFSARFYQQPDFWVDYSQQLREKIKNNELVRLLLCGGKGVGKSTLLRYTVNRFLKESRTVLVIDFDPGQPEFTSTGCVSATLVSKPLLGPNFTHLDHPPLCSFFIGDSDITANPKLYMDSCTQLLNYCCVQPSLANVPTVINTMGFTTGVGVDVTLDLIRLARPNHVLQVSSRSLRRNFPAPLEQEYVSSHRRGWLTGGDSNPLNYQFDVIQSAAEESERSLEEWGFRAAALRRIGLLSYFSRLSDSSDWSLSDAVPYRISWDQLSLCVCHQFVPPSLVTAAFNASLVALCILDPETASSVPCCKADGYPTILQEAPLMPCIGYGIVRCIDNEQRCVYLITPEPIERLNQVNCLVMGGIQLPECMLLDVPLALRKHHGVQSGPKYRVPYAIQGPSAVEPSCRPYRKYNPVFTIRNGGHKHA